MVRQKQSFRNRACREAGSIASRRARGQAFLLCRATRAGQRGGRRLGARGSRSGGRLRSGERYGGCHLVAQASAPPGQRVLAVLSLPMALQGPVCVSHSRLGKPFTSHPRPQDSPPAALPRWCQERVGGRPRAQTRLCPVPSATGSAPRLCFWTPRSAGPPPQPGTWALLRAAACPREVFLPAPLRGPLCSPSLTAGHDVCPPGWPPALPSPCPGGCRTQRGRRVSV